MVQIGKINRLTIRRELDDVVHLDGGEDGNIALPIQFVPENCHVGDEVEVFVYMDKTERLRAIIEKPIATVGQFAKMQVVAIASAGAYLDWGLQKNLLAPNKEQRVKMVEGKSYVVYVLLDENSKRIAASSKLDKFLSRQPPTYKEGEEVDIIICEKTDLGYKAIIDNAHWGMVYKNEVFKKIHIGQKMKGYIKQIRLDLKIDLSLQPAGHKKLDGISQDILNSISAAGGFITITDKSMPDDIYAMFGISKKSFKKAIGALYKRRLISISEEGIKLTK